MHKYDMDKNPHYVIKNSVFLLEHYITDAKLSFPPESLLDVFENNTIVWLGEGSYPGDLPSSGFHIMTGQRGRDFWKAMVTDWHNRHPNVGADRKPSDPGTFVVGENSTRF